MTKLFCGTHRLIVLLITITLINAVSRSAKADGNPTVSAPTAVNGGTQKQNTIQLSNNSFPCKFTIDSANGWRVGSIVVQSQDGKTTYANVPSNQITFFPDPSGTGGYYECQVSVGANNLSNVSVTVTDYKVNQDNSVTPPKFTTVTGSTTISGLYFVH